MDAIGFQNGVELIAFLEALQNLASEESEADGRTNGIATESFSATKRKESTFERSLKEKNIQLVKENSQLSKALEASRKKVEELYAICGLLKGTQYMNEKIYFWDLNDRSSEQTNFWRQSFLLMLASMGESLGGELEKAFSTIKEGMEKEGESLKELNFGRSDRLLEKTLYAFCKGAENSWKARRLKDDFARSETNFLMGLASNPLQNQFDNNRLSQEEMKKRYPNLFVDSKEACAGFMELVFNLFDVTKSSDFQDEVFSMSHGIGNKPISVLEVHHAWMAKKGNQIAHVLKNPGEALVEELERLLERCSKETPSEAEKEVNSLFDLLSTKGVISSHADSVEEEEENTDNLEEALDALFNGPKVEGPKELEEKSLSDHSSDSDDERSSSCDQTKGSSDSSYFYDVDSDSSSSFSSRTYSDDEEEISSSFSDTSSSDTDHWKWWGASEGSDSEVDEEDLGLKALFSDSEGSSSEEEVAGRR